MAKSGYHHVSEEMKKHDSSFGSNNSKRLVQFRKQPAVLRVSRPTNLPRARTLGYRAKPGFVVVRSRVRKGTRQKKRPNRGRKPHAMGVNKYTPKKSLQRIAEERAQRKFGNLEALNSYFVLQDGRFKWFEVIFVDPHHPAIIPDPKINWIGVYANKRRAYRGLTSAGKRGRGLHKRGKGTEKNRPSLRAHGNRGK